MSDTFLVATTEGGIVQIQYSSFVDNLAQSVLGQSDFPDAFPYSGAGGVQGNQAIGGAQSIVPAGTIGIAGGALGGGVANFGSLAINGSQFRENVVRGADDVDSTAAVYAGTGFPGGAFGGGLSNHGQATVQSSRFDRNVAEAGDRGIGDFATIASAGAIYNDQFLEVSRSRFTENTATSHGCFERGP